MANKFSQFIFNQFRKNETCLHQLSYLFWECTRRCNMKCLHCGSDCSAGSETEDLPFDDFLGAILPLKEMYKPDSITVAITGGEPLMRKDLPECGVRLRRHGFLWGIVTNGYDYTPDMHGRLLAAGMGSIALSLDGLAPAHNWLRGNDQSFKRALKALALITSAKHLTYDVITCVNQKNIYELEKIKEFCNRQCQGVEAVYHHANREGGAPGTMNRNTFLRVGRGEYVLLNKENYGKYIGFEKFGNAVYDEE